MKGERIQMSLEEALEVRNNLQRELYEFNKSIKEMARNRAEQLLEEIRNRIEEMADLGYYFTVYDKCCQDDQAGYVYHEEWIECDITEAPEKPF